MGPIKSIVTISLMLMLLFEPAVAAAQNTLVVGIFPRRNATETTRMFTPMIHFLTAKLGCQVQLATTRNFKSFWEGVKKQEYDIVHFNQYQYVKAHKELGYKVILKNIEFGESTIAGSILVRRDSDIESVADLKGRKILFGGGPQAMQSYIVATYLLRRHGLQPDQYETSFAKNPPNAIVATYYGRFAAAGAGDKVLQLAVVTNQIDISKMRYLLRGEQLPHLPWAVKASMPKTLAEKIRDLLSKMHLSRNGRKILLKAKLDGMALANDREYDAHRRIILEMLGEQY